MKTTHAKQASLLILAFIMIASITSQAQRPGRNCPNGPGRAPACHIPDLTDQQQSTIDSLTVIHLKEMKTLRNEMGEKEARLKTLTSADNADMAAINKSIDEISVLKANMAKKREAHRQSVRGMLNEKQRLYFDTHHGSHGGAGYGPHGKGAGKMGGNRPSGGMGCGAKSRPNR